MGEQKKSQCEESWFFESAPTSFSDPWHVFVFFSKTQASKASFLLEVHLWGFQFLHCKNKYIHVSGKTGSMRTEKLESFPNSSRPKNFPLKSNKTLERIHGMILYICHLFAYMNGWSLWWILRLLNTTLPWILWVCRWTHQKGSTAFWPGILGCKDPSEDSKTPVGNWICFRDPKKQLAWPPYGRHPNTWWGDRCLGTRNLKNISWGEGLKGVPNTYCTRQVFGGFFRCLIIGPCHSRDWGSHCVDRQQLEAQSGTCPKRLTCHAKMWKCRQWQTRRMCDVTTCA